MEQGVRELWKELCPGVFVAQFFDPERLASLRAYLDHVADADIPVRPPYGIALNRGGAMLDRDGHARRLPSGRPSQSAQQRNPVE